MISVVQMPLPMRAAIEPSDWPQRWAPSPESLMISTMCSLSCMTGTDEAPAALPGALPAVLLDFCALISGYP